MRKILCPWKFLSAQPTRQCLSDTAFIGEYLNLKIIQCSPDGRFTLMVHVTASLYKSVSPESYFDSSALFSGLLQVS